MSWPIQSLWVGNSLSALEQLCMRSFIANGHEFHLYTYKPLEGVPEGTVLRDGNEILPSASVFRDPDIGSFSGFSDLFRYKLLLDRAGWWVDLDVVCVRPVPPPRTEYAFPLEGPNALGSCALFSQQPGSEVFQSVWDFARKKDHSKLVWCEIGARLFWEPIRRLSLDHCLMPPQTFCPVPCSRWFDTFVPGRISDFGLETVGVHFWHEMWRRARLDKDEDYGPRSLYERLKRKYRVTAKISESR
jgi:hypothetical protein